ncbi:MAG: uncharacterized protein JWP97_5239 [Labilithrix sp.]|nr:uncharacterized protein [Labilithrix sp.]
MAARTSRSLVGGMLVVAVVLAPIAAWAGGPESRTCIASADEAQLARYRGKLGAAREGFVKCARTECPGPIRNDCLRWLAEVDAGMPTVVLGAAWSDDGGDVVDAQVRVDGAVVPDAASGRAVPLDPGEHAVVFTRDPAPPVAITIIVREGEKNRPVRATLVRPVRAKPLAPVVAPAPAARVPVVSWVLGGVAVAAVGSGIGWYVAGRNGLAGLRDTCGHSCPPSDVDDQRRKLLVGDISVVLGIAALGAASWFFFHRPSPPTPALAF